MSMRMGQAQCSIASAPETAMEFLKKQDANFSSRPPIRAGEVVMYEQDMFFQNSSSLWRQRKISQMKFTDSKRLEATQHVRAEETAHLIRSMPQNREIELRTYLCVLFNNIISRLVLNWRLSARLGEHETEEQMLEVKNFKEITHEISYCLRYTTLDISFRVSSGWIFRGSVAKSRSAGESASRARQCGGVSTVACRSPTFQNLDCIQAVVKESLQLHPYAPPIHHACKAFG